MLGKLGLPVMALGAMLAFGTTKPANAQVRFGVQVGPAYSYPACTVYDPYNCPPYAYSPYPVYPAPYVYGGWGWHHDRDWDRGERGRAFEGGREFHGDRGRDHGGNAFRGREGGHGERR